MQESPGVHLKIALPPTTLASFVLKRFCKEYSLSEQDCMLSCTGQSVNSSKRLHEVYQNRVLPLFVLVVATSSASVLIRRWSANGSFAAAPRQFHRHCMPRSHLEAICCLTHLAGVPSGRSSRCKSCKHGRCLGGCHSTVCHGL